MPAVTYEQICDLAVRLGRFKVDPHWIRYPTWASPPLDGGPWLQKAAGLRERAKRILLGQEPRPDWEEHHQQTCQASLEQFEYGAIQAFILDAITAGWFSPPCGRAGIKQIKSAFIEYMDGDIALEDLPAGVGDIESLRQAWITRLEAHARAARQSGDGGIEPEIWQAGKNEVRDEPQARRRVVDDFDYFGYRQAWLDYQAAKAKSKASAKAKPDSKASSKTRPGIPQITKDKPVVRRAVREADAAVPGSRSEAAADGVRRVSRGVMSRASSSPVHGYKPDATVDAAAPPFTRRAAKKTAPRTACTSPVIPEAECGGVGLRAKPRIHASVPPPGGAVHGRNGDRRHRWVEAWRRRQRLSTPPVPRRWGLSRPEGARSPPPDRTAAPEREDVHHTTGPPPFSLGRIPVPIGVL